MNEINDIIESLAKTALQAKPEKATSSEPPPDRSWVMKLVLAFIVIAGVIWLRYRLFLKGKELADARTQLEHRKIDAERARFQAALEASEIQRALLKHEAKTKLESAAAKEVELAKLEAQHAEQIKKVEALRNWDELNALAGVK